MSKYNVTLTFQASVCVEAESEDEAVEIAKEMTDNMAFLELLDWDAKPARERDRAANV